MFVRHHHRLCERKPLEANACPRLALTRTRPTTHPHTPAQVLMASRSLDPRTRLLALETVAQLAGRLREEYLVRCALP